MNSDFNQRDLRVNISKTIKKYVYENEITYRELAKRAGITYTKISEYVNLTTTPTIETLLRLCEVMQISMNEITGITPYYQYDELLDSLENTITSFEKRGVKNENNN